MIKTLLSAFAVTALLTGAAHAGDYSKMVVDKTPVVYPPAPTGCECFAPGAQFSGFVSGIFPEDNAFDDEIGGGISIGYFFTENIGIDLSGAIYATDSEFHNYTADLVLRYPIKDLCIAPYIFGGGGVHTNSETEGIARLGAGIDIRFDSCWGVFADGAYTWVDGDEIADYAIARAGIRIPF